MAYQAKRSKKLKEDFELVDESGNILHSLEVSLDADDMVIAINRKYTTLTKALAETTELQRKAKNREDLTGSMEILGRAMVDLIEAVFGERNSKILLEFYEGKYLEMSREVLPFISNVVMPRLLEIRKENRQETLKRYNRKQRRAMFKR